jgi:hypothetical protein
VRQQSQILEQAGHAEPSDPMGRQSRDGPAGIKNASLVGTNKPRGDIEESCLARTVGANDASDAPGVKTRIHLAQGTDSTKRLGDLLQF